MITLHIGPREGTTLPKKYVPVKDKNSVVLLDCRREGWDDESSQYERCGSLYTMPGCGCHENHCPDCSAEIHGFSIMLPGVIERSAIEHHCSTKGNW